MSSTIYALMLCGTMFNYHPGQCRLFDAGSLFRSLARCETESDLLNDDYARARTRDQKLDFAYTKCFERDGNDWRPAKRMAAPYIRPGARTTVMPPDIVSFLTKAKREQCPALGKLKCRVIETVIEKKGFSSEEEECVWQMTKMVTPEMRTERFWTVTI
jgi:hypothetical protein